MKKKQYLCAVLTIRKKVMIKMFVMPTCPYCDYVEKQVEL